jgi:hypothetical protein
VAISTRAADSYNSLSWGPVAPAIQALPSMVPAPLTVDTFRHFFRKMPAPEMRELVKACGHPADEWDRDTADHPGEKIPAHLRMYYAGHFFRYTFPDGSHVYVWSGGDNGSYVMRADYLPTTGHVAPLYLRSL